MAQGCAQSQDFVLMMFKTWGGGGSTTANPLLSHRYKGFAIDTTPLLETD
jgi:hypothetical protein